MSDSGRSLDVLKRLLKKVPEVKPPPEELVETYLAGPPKESAITKKKRGPGRPAKEDHLKARNYTLCLDPKYVRFLDSMKVHDKKVQGRGRKVRFIIDQFLELHRRQRIQLEVLGQALENVETVLRNHSSQVKKGQKLELQPRERTEITKTVNQVALLVKVLGFNRKELHKLLPRSKWAVYAFCLDWQART